MQPDHSASREELERKLRSIRGKLQWRRQCAKAMASHSWQGSFPAKAFPKERIVTKNGRHRDRIISSPMTSAPLTDWETSTMQPLRLLPCDEFHFTNEGSRRPWDIWLQQGLGLWGAGAGPLSWAVPCQGTPGTPVCRALQDGAKSARRPHDAVTRAPAAVRGDAGARPAENLYMITRTQPPSETPGASADAKMPHQALQDAGAGVT